MKFHHLLAVVLLLVGCTETKQANQPTTYPAYAPGAPVPGGLQVAFAQPNPPVLTATKMVTFVQGNLLVHFNGAATQPGQVIAQGTIPGMTFSMGLGSAKFGPGQTDVRVPIAFTARESGRMPFLVKVAGAPDSAGFRTEVSVEFKEE